MANRPPSPPAVLMKLIRDAGFEDGRVFDSGVVDELVLDYYDPEGTMNNEDKKKKWGEMSKAIQALKKKGYLSSETSKGSYKVLYRPCAGMPACGWCPYCRGCVAQLKKQVDTNLWYGPEFIYSRAHALSGTANEGTEWLKHRPSNPLPVWRRGYQARFDQKNPEENPNQLEIVSLEILEWDDV